MNNNSFLSRGSAPLSRRGRSKRAAGVVAAASGAAIALAIFAPRAAEAAALKPCPAGMVDTILDPFINQLDDGSYFVDNTVVSQIFPNGIPFIQTYSDLWVNINGNLSFGQSVSTFTPDAIPGLSIPTIAAFFADVDLRSNQGDLHMCINTQESQLMFTWDQVGYYSNQVDKLNSFQIILTHNDASVCGAAATFNIEFRYEQLQWTTGDASGGSGGLGGTPATAGIDAGDQINAVALPGSHTGAVLDLVNLSNANEPGSFVFLVAAGTLPACGNGKLDLCEVCDDGNGSNDDGCTNVCHLNVCGDGFVYTGVEECDGVELDPSLTCPTGFAGTPRCNNDPANPSGDGTCTAGFEDCVDIDECLDPAANDCDAHATCANTVGAYTCACKNGYAGDGFTCDDVDECAAGTDNCDLHASCTNTSGSFTCKCDPLYAGNGAVCVAIDSDGDGLTDVVEIQIGTDPDDQDSDDDGLLDGLELNPGGDSDGDGFINALDPDSDNDGLFDGTELGFDCSNPDTDLAAGHCVPDADQGATVTDPTNPDTDGGGTSDGSEDPNGNGGVDPGESDPAGPGDDGLLMDSDGDGISDVLELQLGTNPDDSDSDDDGVYDGIEVNPTLDSDGDGLVNLLDPDSDNDGLFDGTEMGLGCSLPDTDLSTHRCIPDADNGATHTSPIKADTDGGTIVDGSEDGNHNGVVDPGETDPTLGHPGDDLSIVDTDSDGLSDLEEITFGSDPNDNDSDDDGLVDGLEANPTSDDDGDGAINANDPDSDNDGIWDGTEKGFGCFVQGAIHCIPDADMGATKTNPLKADTDDGGVKDGVEDKNHNGAIDAGETDPNDPTDDVCSQSSDCAIPTQVCDPVSSKCVDAKCDANTPCPLPDVCHFAGVCEPASGTCTYPNKQNGAPCTDDNVCTADACVDGACTSFSVLDGTPCTDNGDAGLCIAGHCLTDSNIGGAGGGGVGGNNGGASAGGGGAGGNGAGANGGDGAGANGGGGAGANGAGAGKADDAYRLTGGACSTSSSSSDSNVAFGALALALALTLSRRRSARRTG